jgi:hypothetical protein
MPPAYIAWRTNTTNRVVGTARVRLHGIDPGQLLKICHIWAQYALWILHERPPPPHHLGAFLPTPPSMSLNRLFMQGSSFRQNIGAGINPVVPAFLIVPVFWSLWLSGRCSFPVITAFRSLQLSGHSNFPVITAFRSLQLSGHSSFPVIPAFRSFQLSGHYSFSGHSGCFLVVPVTENKKILKKGEAPRTIRHK